MKRVFRFLCMCCLALTLTSCEVILETLLYTMGAMSMPYSMPMSGGYGYDAYPTYGAYVGDSYSGGSSSNTTSSDVCYVCKGTGRVEKLTYVGSSASDKYCSECGKMVSAGHYHTRCTSCNGTGHR